MEKGALGNERIVLIGGSAGSLEALLQFLPLLRADLPFPIVIIMHRKASGDASLGELLGIKTGLRFKEIEDKDSLNAGTIYIAPGDYHLLFEKDKQTLSLDYSEKVNFSRPSIDVCFSSAADVFGSGLTGILLSGANADGTEGLAAIRAAGGITIVQHPEEAEVSIMPQHAIDKNVAAHILYNEEIANFINMQA
jgi:two-component system, chemotaxis family, protein-glutamate methylesterase/glutaminase